MSTAHRLKSLFVILVLCFALGVPAFAQTETATLSGVIQDPHGRVVPDVEVSSTRIETGTVVTTKTNGAGIYFFTGLMPGHYHLMVRKPGFKEIAIKEFQLYVQDKLEQNFALEIGSVSESVTVNASDLHVNTTDPSVSTVVDRKYVENMPLNGRSFQDLILLTPGVVTNTPQSSFTGSGVGGEFSVNGQRTESNYYTVDGISANTGIFGSPGVPSASGSLPSATVLGTTQSLVSVDALEEFRVHSSTYSAEYGRNPGGQFSFVTRSGNNQWHGTAFDYLRNNVFDANDWFNGFLGQPQPPLRQNDFGGTLGGPIKIPRVYDGKDKTFFFFSYEGLRLIQPQAATISFVPDTALRNSAATILQPVMNGFPVQNGPEILMTCDPATDPSCPPSGQKPTGMAEFIGSWSNPSQIDSYSIRLDHAVGNRLRLFFRFADTPSTVSSRSGGSLRDPSVLGRIGLTSRTFTVGATSAFSSRFSNELRFGYSSNKQTVAAAPDRFRGAQAPNLFQLQGVGTSPRSDIEVNLYFDSFQFLTTIVQTLPDAQQKQWNLTDAGSLTFGRHQIKFGVDWRRSTPTYHQANPTILYYFFSPSSVQANTLDFAQALAKSAADPVYTNFSAFAQDEWRATSRLALSVGLRWDVNPAPGAANGNLPYTAQGATIGTLSLAPQGTPLWNTAWFNFAPRLGAAYVLRTTPGLETVLRGGAGVFFDTGQQLGSLGYDGPGFSTFNAPLSGAFPLPTAQAVLPIVNPPVAPYTNDIVYAFYPHLQLPFTLQWNASFQQGLGKAQTFTLSYIGANGRRLLQENEVVAGPLNRNFGVVTFIKNGQPSDYNALQAQFQRTLTRRLSALGSYTWSHCLDYGSQNNALPFQRGNCDFDVRNNFSSALSYDLPDAFQNSFARAVLHHWGLDDRFTARTGFPVSVNGGFVRDSATGQLTPGGTNIVPGHPFYLSGSQFPGGREINPAAFSRPPAGQLGDAPRNFVRGFGAWQMDFAVRREFPVRERLKLQFRAEAFNIFNHPNFGTVNANLCSPGPGCTFGQATATLANSLGGLSPLYQMGGARSMQFALKLVF
jgi:hypothetical protein